ncbi:MAG: acyl-CoA synthetase [Pseudomonadota bacterium]
MAEATPPALLDHLLAHDGASVAISDAAGSVTYGELLARSAVAARALLDRDRAAPYGGARVLVLVPPGPAFVTALLGVWRAGGVAVPVSTQQTAPELEHMAATAAPRATVVGDGVSERLDAWMRGPGAARIGRRMDMAALEARAGTPVGAAAEHPATSAGPHDPALMLFTSGTTGKPKGVTLSHAGIAATVDALHGAWRWRADDRLLHALPLNHTHGLIVALLGALRAGANVQFTAFDAVAVWEAFAGATVFMAVPTMYVRLVEALRAAAPAARARWIAGARSLRLATSGSAALPPSLLNAFAEATGQTILERYGMTEIGMALSNPYDGPRVPGSVGLPLPGVTIDIIDEQEDPVAVGEPGELRVRSPQLFLGYHGDPEATATAHDAAGRFRTGDTGVRARDGTIRLLGRTSVDILKSGGYKLSALEIEDALRAHPAVADIAVIGVPDPVWGDCVTACVVARDGAPAPTLDDLRAFARDVLAPYKLPRAVRVLAALPRNPMGKIQKSLLK